MLAHETQHGLLSCRPLLSFALFLCHPTILWSLAIITLSKNTAVTNRCPSVAVLFDGRVDALEQCMQRSPIQLIQGYTGSLWTLPSGNYLLRIAPVATRATGNKTMIKNCTYFARHSNGRGGAPVQHCMHRPMEEVQGFTRSHWTPL